MELDFDHLLQKAKEVLHPRQLSQRAFVGSVAAALLTDQGNIYTGVNIDVPCSMGFCAEHAAAAAMVTAGESRILGLVAVHRTGQIISPCGRCREFLYQLNRENLGCRVLLAKNRIVTLAQLLPEQWDEELERE